ncbi:Oidioi.mRNA.OKI2018_I69.chr1.g308.t1.cds [Oikopleura dioica]|uniref:Oidioi.mRNA.OKI2018_I69.chr1.g308.t1.cds n=1 Tax=Oikopleura dioica TaxID=34765 RepID=A0ABN7SL53_OIKDI|nr:Oidioi.mRNA.OKI2018_I69.chr1.g308.t1.cds [Oikopleura dioica]
MKNYQLLFVIAFILTAAFSIWIYKLELEQKRTAEQLVFCDAGKAPVSRYRKKLKRQCTLESAAEYKNGNTITKL